MSPTTPKASHRDLTDPTQLAVEVTEVKGTLALLQQQVSGGLSNVSSQLASVQGDMRDMGKQLGALALAQADFTSHSSGLDRLAKAIEKSTVENSEWRKAHELTNQQTADKVTAFDGAIRALRWMVGIVVTLAVFGTGVYLTAATNWRSGIEGRIDRLETRP